MGECWDGPGVSIIVLPYKTSESDSEFLIRSGDQPTEKIVTFVVLLLSSSGANLNALTATTLPFHTRFHRSVYPRVAKGISSCILKSSSIRQDPGSLPNVPHNLRSVVNAMLLRSPGMSAC